MAGEGDAPELGTPVGEDPSCGDPGCGEPFDDKVQEHGCRLGGVVTGYEIDDGPAGVGIDCGELPQGLSSSLCKRAGSWCSYVGVDAVGVDEGELFEGLFPVRCDLAFDEAAGGFALVGGESEFFRALSGPFVLDVADR